MTITQANVSGTPPTTTGPNVGRVSGVTGVDLRTGSQTMAFRVKWATAATNIDMYGPCMSVAANGRGIFLQRRSGDAGTVLIAYRYSGTTFSTVANATGAYGSTSAWVHVCVTYDGTTIRTYVDGVASGTAASASTFMAAGANDEMSLCGPVSGEVADVCFFSRALSADDVLQLSKQRLPKSANGDCLGFFPTVDTASLTAAGRDYSGAGNDCTLQNTGSNNPAAAQGSVPTNWGGAGIVPVFRTAPVELLGQGDVSVAASAAIKSAVAFTGTGASSVAASATVSVATSLVGLGQSSVSASAAIKEAVALQGTGASSVSGSATVGEAAALTGSGQTSVSATGTLASGALAGAGNVSVSGAADVSAAVALGGVGNSSVAASGTVGQGRAVDGTGASSVSAAATVSQGRAISGQGASSVSGSAAISVATSLSGTGQVSVSGAASFDLTPVGGTTGDDQPVDRRFLGALGSRRKVRR